MELLAVTRSRTDAAARPFDIRLVAAFFAIYVLWGTTFLAIRIAVLEVPPLFAAGLRFFIAGALLYGFMRMKGTARPRAAEWRSLAAMALLMFVAVYAPLFWAEKYVSSGLASLLEATLPLITMVIETLVLRRERFRRRVLWPVLIGFAGVAVLLLAGGSERFQTIPCLAILAGGTSWALGSVLTRSMVLPRSKPLTAGAAMMLGGGTLLALSALCGEMHPFPHVSLKAGLAILYLIVFGSLVAFTAFVWLLSRMPATRVASHAYVNPNVAVALGCLAAGEVVTTHMLIGAVLVLTSVFAILRAGSRTSSA